MLGGVAVWRQHDHVNAQGSGGLGGVLPYIDQGFAVEVSARAIEAQVRNAFKPGQQRGVVGNHMRIFGIDVVAYLVAHGAAVNEHNHGSGNILNGFFCNPDRHIILSDNVFMEGFVSKRQCAAVDALEEAAFFKVNQIIADRFIRDLHLFGQSNGPCSSMFGQRFQNELFALGC